MTTDELAVVARSAKTHAYCPYSGYAVGCAIQTVSGKVFSGCNIENVSFGLTICAERAALAQMVSAGEREIETIYVVTRDGGSPCGMCRQTLIEFLSPEKDAQVFVEAEGGTVKEYSLRSLLPASFNAELDKLPG